MAIPSNPFAKVNQPSKEEEPIPETSAIFGDSTETENEIPSIQNEQQGIHMQNQGSNAFAPAKPTANTFSPAKASGFNPQPKPTTSFSKPAETNHTAPASGSKYNIIDLAWVVNMKLTANQRLDEGEAAVLMLGYNADFNNLRVVFRSAEQSAFSPSSINLPGTKIITSMNLFSETCAEILYKKGTGEQIQVLERMFKLDQSWAPNQSIITWDSDMISLYSKMSNGTVISFFLYQWQIDLFAYGLQFMLDKAPSLHMEATFRK